MWRTVWRICMLISGLKGLKARAFNVFTFVHQAVEEDMDSHGSDDSETFTTPPGSIITGNDSERLQTECPEGEEAMEDERGEDEWKSIMPEVCMGIFLFIQMSNEVFSKSKSYVVHR